jgi:hypothetical protein
MSLNLLINEQIKNVLNKNTTKVINSISEKLDVSKDMLVDIWNKLNTDFKIKHTPVIIDEDIPNFKEIEIIDEDIVPEIRVEIIDEDF